MKKQTALLLSTLVLMSVVAVQPAHAFKCKCDKLKFWEKKSKPVVEAPVKKEIVPVKAVEPKKEEAKVVPAVKTTPVVKPVAKTVAPAAKPAVKPACPCAKAPVKK